MHPNGEELLRGVLGTLATHVLPEVQTAHAQIQMALVLRLLGIAADEMDGGAQRLVEDNAALRELAGRGADALASAGDAAGPEGASLAGELRSMADEKDSSVLLSDLSAANVRLPLDFQIGSHRRNGRAASCHVAPERGPVVGRLAARYSKPDVFVGGTFL